MARRTRFNKRHGTEAEKESNRGGRSPPPEQRRLCKPAQRTAAVDKHNGRERGERVSMPATQGSGARRTTHPLLSSPHPFSLLDIPSAVARCSLVARCGERRAAAGGPRITTVTLPQNSHHRLASHSRAQRHGGWVHVASVHRNRRPGAFVTAHRDERSDASL